MPNRLILGLLIASFLVTVTEAAPQASAQEDQILERGDKLIEEAKALYEDARSKESVEAFVDAGFKLEEARIKFIVLQEIGSPEKQKIATDRLRAINQLNKLIHDGKVAITGTPAESPDPAPPKPSDPAPGTPGPAASKPPPGLKPVDVSKRNPIPDAAKQREAEKTIRDLFKDQYAKKAQEDRKILARLLIDHAAKSQDDVVAQWVLYREAQEAATQACDVAGVIAAIDATSQVYDIDALVMKNVAFIALGKTAKTPDDYAWLAIGRLKFLDELVAVDLYDLADKASAAALQDARKANDPNLITRATNRAKEVGEVKSLFQTMKSSLQTLAKTPDDPGANLEMGKFLCFGKGSWDLGLRFLVKGSDPNLKANAEKELSQALQSADRIAVADGWWDLAEKEKSPTKKSQMISHSRTLYESALPDANALARVKIEKRLAEAAVQKFSTPINLLREYEAGKWKNLCPGRGDWVKGKEGYTFRGVAGGGPDFGWTYPLPKGITSFNVKFVFRVKDVGATQIVFVEKTDAITGTGVALSYNWSKGFSVGNLNRSSSAEMKTVNLPKLDKGWHNLDIKVSPTGIAAKLDNLNELQWSGKVEPTSITVSGDEFEDWMVSDFVFSPSR